MFEPHGELQQVLLLSAGTMAMVDLERTDEAAKAFRAVAYRRLGFILSGACWGCLRMDLGLDHSRPLHLSMWVWGQNCERSGLWSKRWG